MLQNWLEKTATAKRLGAKESILMRELERQLDANIFLDEDQKWGPQSLQRPFILYQMFCHAAAHGKRECDRTICWGWRQSSPKWGLKAEVPVMDLIWPGMLWVDIRNIYNDVYQLKRLPGESPCDNATVENICQSILESVKEHLWHRWECTKLPEQCNSTSTLSSDPPLEFKPRAHAPYKHTEPETMRKPWQWHKTCIARHSWQQTSWRITLSGWVNRSPTGDPTVTYGHAVTDTHSHRCLKTHERPLSAGHQWPVPPAAACKGDPVRRWTLSPSPTWPRRQVTFKESSPGRGTEVKQFLPSTSGDRQSLEATDSQLLSWAEESKDLGYPPKLDPQMQEFLSRVGVIYTGNENSDWSLTLELPLDDNNKWVMWYTCWVETPAWWPKLQRVPNQMDTIQFARQVSASFQLPKVMCLTLKTQNDYLVPPMPHCIERDTFLPFSTVSFGSQDYWMKQLHKTFTDMKALQF